MSHVVNYDLPNVSETYVHRIGRTARAGKSGIAISFCDGEERAYLKDIEKLIGQKITLIEDHPFPDDGVIEQPVKTQQNNRSGGEKRNNFRRNTNNTKKPYKSSKKKFFQKKKSD